MAGPDQSANSILAKLGRLPVTSGSVSALGTTMRVVVFPNRFAGNPYFQDFLGGLHAVGIRDVRLAHVLRLRSGFDVMHFHFPEQVVTEGSLFQSIAITICVLCVMSYARLTKRPIVWMVHDVDALWQRRHFLLSLFMPVFRHCISGYVFLSQSSQRKFYEKNPKERTKPFVFAPLGRFQTTLYDDAVKRKLRERYNIQPTEVLVSFLGDIKPYKGIECVASIPQTTAAGTTVKLAICGRNDRGSTEEMISNLLRGWPKSSYVRVPSRLTDDEMALWIQASDAVLLPYSKGSNSGMAMNVFSNHGRIISSNIAVFTELADQCGDIWIRCVDMNDPKMIKGAIDGLDAWSKLEPDIERLEAVLEKGNPVANGAKLRRFYEELSSRGLRRT